MTSIFGGGGVLSANSTPAFKFQELPVTDGQTLFTLSNFSYVLGTQSLWVFINGQKAVVGVDYNETTTGSFTWTYPLTALDTIEAIGVALASITADVASATAAAQASATSAANSATSASNSATAAAASATTASTAAGAASTSASSAGTSATAAASSATSAASSASAANSSATAASGSATTATAQAANASTSASNAASSATSASTSATSASGSATTATTAASTATTQAGNASTSATNAASSATAAASSAASAAAAAASGLYRQVLDKSANYTILPADAGTLFRANTGSGSVTFTLPQISTVTDGFRVSVVKWTSDGNQAVINRSGSDTINGATSVAISAQYSQVIFVADFETNTWFASQSGLGATSANVDPFTGNGTTGPFTLSVDPGNKNNTDVFFGGVHQDHSTYSVSGTALTFSTVTPAGVSIEVKYSTPLPIGVPSDGTVSTVKIADAAVTTAKLSADLQGATFGFKNRIINGQLFINQRVVSGTVILAAGAYGHDRFKGGASGCTYTFATSNNVTTLTISAGSLIQVVEGLNLESGTYTLSWTGTAQGKIGAGSFSASGVIGSITGGTNTNIEFNTGTVSYPQLEKGSTATSFDYRPYGTELALCQRYGFGITNGVFCATGTVRTGGTAGYLFRAPPVPMRATPTITYSSAPSVYVGDTNNTITALSTGSADGNTNAVGGYSIGSGVGSNGQSVTLYTNTGTNLFFSAEL